MDIQKIKYSQDLMKNKIKLAKKLKIINEELEELQKNCDHVLVTAGYCEPSLYRDTIITECLFCRAEVFKSTNYPFINALTYKRGIYGDGSSEDDRNERVKELQELWLKNMALYPEATQEELIEKLKTEIEADENKNKTREKSLGYKFI